MLKQLKYAVVEALAYLLPSIHKGEKGDKSVIPNCRQSIVC